MLLLWKCFPIKVIGVTSQLSGRRVDGLGRALSGSFYSHFMFHSCPILHQQPNHRLFKSVDWDKVEGGMFAVVDPIDQHAILYLSERDYRVSVRVALSTDSPLVVLARAGEPRPLLQSVVKPTSLAASSNANFSSDESKSTSSDVHGDTTDNSKNTPPLSLEDLVRLTARLYALPANQRRMHKIVGWPRSILADYSGGKEGDAMIPLTQGNLDKIFAKWGQLTLYWLDTRLAPRSSFVSALEQIIAHLKKVHAHQGSNGVIKLLKCSSVILRRYLARDRVRTAWELGHPVQLDRSGLPLWFPLPLRLLLRQQHLMAVRWTFTLLQSYKALKGPYKTPKFETITMDSFAFKAGDLEGFQSFCKEQFWPLIWSRAGPARPKLQKPNLAVRSSGDLALSLTAGPNASVSFLGAPWDTLAWEQAPTNWLIHFATLVGNSRLVKAYQAVLAVATRIYGDPSTTTLQISRTVKSTQFVSKSGQVLKGPAPNARKRVRSKTVPVELTLGKLSLRYEAAGKVRVFAIVDYWTQRVLAPLHDWMFDVLKTFPTDATFDQQGSLERFMLNHPKDGFSYDLKSATDTIPQELYRAVLTPVLGEDVVEGWLSLLCDRWYRTPRETHHCAPKYVKYSRGQPMGALSSWPSMALVHHALTLYAAFLEGKDLEIWTEYRVLGDDNTNGCKAVAVRYREESGKLGVLFGDKVALKDEGETRSDECRIPGPMIEFANQFWKGTTNLSPLSLKEEAGIRSQAARIELASRALTRWGLPKFTALIPRLLRLLIGPSLYKETLEGLKLGRLGAISQMALIAAFGPGATTLRRQGYQLSTFVPLLLAVAGKSVLLGGDKRFLLGDIPKGIDVPKGLSTAIALRYLSLLAKSIERKIALTTRSLHALRAWVDKLEFGFVTLPYLGKASQAMVDLIVDHWLSTKRAEVPNDGRPFGYYHSTRNMQVHSVESQGLGALSDALFDLRWSLNQVHNLMTQIQGRPRRLAEYQAELASHNNMHVFWASLYADFIDQLRPRPLTDIVWKVVDGVATIVNKLTGGISSPTRTDPNSLSDEWIESWYVDLMALESITAAAYFDRLEVISDDGLCSVIDGAYCMKIPDLPDALNGDSAAALVCETDALDISVPRALKMLAFQSGNTDAEIIQQYENLFEIPISDNPDTLDELAPSILQEGYDLHAKLSDQTDFTSADPFASPDDIRPANAFEKWRQSARDLFPVLDYFDQSYRLAIDDLELPNTKRGGHRTSATLVSAKNKP